MIEEIKVQTIEVPKQFRRKLPDDRKGRHQKFRLHYEKKDDSGNVTVHELKAHIQTGEYEDGSLGEIFIRSGKPGESIAWLDQWAIATSIALQRGEPVDNLFGKFTHAQFEPYGAVEGVDGIKRCKSILDLVARYIIREYGSGGSIDA